MTYLGAQAAAVLAVAALASSASATNTIHYCSSSASPNLSGQTGCEITSSKYAVTYNEVDADADAVCESLSDQVPAPNPLTGILAAPETCIGTGGSRASSYYNGTFHYPWIGNRHSYAVTIYSATHFDYNTLV